MCKKGYIWNPIKCACENGNYLKVVADDSKIGCDEIIETTKSASTEFVPIKRILTKFNREKVICKTKNFYILFTFLLITMIVLITISICCCFIKYQAKRKYLLPY